MVLRAAPLQGTPVRGRVRAAAGVFLLALVGSAGSVRAEGLDWEIPESQDRSPVGRVLRNLRDGTWALGDALVEANTALFGEASLLAAKLWMGGADLVGLVDDNPWSTRVTRGFFSKHLSKTAYLWHVAGAESLLGSHGLETERWVLAEVGSWNPLLSAEDVDELQGPLPLDPLAFVGEAIVHTQVYRTHVAPLGVAAIVVTDGLLRPAGAVLRWLQLPRPAAACERAGRRVYRRALRSEW